MSADSILYNYLVADSTVLSLIGVSGASPDEVRAYPHELFEKQSLPALLFRRVDTAFTQTIHDDAPSSEQVTYELTCLALTKTTADALANAVLAALGGAWTAQSRLDQESETADVRQFGTLLTGLLEDPSL